MVSCFPENISKAAGLVEALSGVGLIMGPALGSALYAIGDFWLPFTFVAVYFLIGSMLVYKILPESIETSSTESSNPTGKVTFFRLFKNRWILVCSLAAGVNIFQYTFIEPFLPEYMDLQYGVSEKVVGLIFMALSIGYLFSCLTVHKGQELIEPLWLIPLAFVINGCATIFYGPS